MSLWTDVPSLDILTTWRCPAAQHAPKAEAPHSRVPQPGEGGESAADPRAPLCLRFAPPPRLRKLRAARMRGWAQLNQERSLQWAWLICRGVV